MYIVQPLIFLGLVGRRPTQRALKNMVGVVQQPRPLLLMGEVVLDALPGWQGGRGAARYTILTAAQQSIGLNVKVTQALTANCNLNSNLNHNLTSNLNPSGL